MSKWFGCCAAHRKTTPQQLSSSASEPQIRATEQQIAELQHQHQAAAQDQAIGRTPEAAAQWRIAADEMHVVLLHAATGTVVELVGRSDGWFQCRDVKWQMHTVYPDGHVEAPRVQILDAEHLITQIRHEEEYGGSRISEKGFSLGMWSIKKSENGHVMVTHQRQKDQLIILMSLGFCCVGAGGHAVLVDETGLTMLSREEAQAMLLC